MPNFLERWIAPVIAKIPGLQHADPTTEWALMGVSVAIAALSATLAFHFYVRNPSLPKQLSEKFKVVHQAMVNKFYVDEFYFGFIINPLVAAAKNTWFYIDVNFIYKTTYVVSDLVKGTGNFAKSLQTGNIQQYAMYISIGIVSALTIILMR